MRLYSICVFSVISCIFLVFVCAQNISVDLEKNVKATSDGTTYTTNSIDEFQYDNTTTEKSTTEVIPTTTTNKSTSQSVTTEVTTESTTTTSTTPRPCDITDINITNIIVLPAKTEVNVTINWVNLTNCSPDNTYGDVNVSCNASSDWNWVVKQASVTLKWEYDTNEINFTISGLSEFTNYTCWAYLLQNGGENELAQFNFSTKKEVPSPPTNILLKNITWNSFEITWLAPEKIPSLLEGYEVNITIVGVGQPGHIWRQCNSPIYPNKIHSFIVTDGTTFVFDQALPDLNYNIALRAKSDVGYGEKVLDNVTTLPTGAEAPIFLNVTLSEEEHNKSVNITGHITWEMPCNTNGPVSEFNIDILGVYTVQNDRHDSHTERIQIVNDSVVQYFHNFSSLYAASNYTVKVYLVGNSTDKFQGLEANSSFITNSIYPNNPKVETAETGTNSLTLSWLLPTNYPGPITGYNVKLSFNELLWNKTEFCKAGNPWAKIVSPKDPQYLFDSLEPYSSYSYSISALTSRGSGITTDNYTQTQMSSPDSFNISEIKIKDSQTENYNVSAAISFEPRCFNGEFKEYQINIIGKRSGYDDLEISYKTDNYTQTTFNFSLMPETTYSVEIIVFNAEHNTRQKESFISPAGVPTFSPGKIEIKPEISKTESTITLNRSQFNTNQGAVTYLAIIVSDKNVTGGEYKKWTDTNNWPLLKKPPGVDIYYQATPKFWNPFSESEEVRFTIGNETNCSDDDELCNRPLEAGKTYFVFIRIFNNNYYRNTMPWIIVTEKVSILKAILGSVFGVIALAIIGFAGFIAWKKGYFQRFKKKPQGPTTEIPQKKFIEYCKLLEQNRDVLHEQWLQLEEKSKEIYTDRQCHFSVLPENKRKNRYANILPFDHTRVTLNIDEDDEICSDYINASFIKGFSGQYEYIATQGPLCGTCRDFWKMVIQENVSIIVMVARFEENNRDKCYKYFPNNHETMTIGDDIEVRCSTELHFGIYCVRTLQVKKDLKQTTVTHMQFLEWPDFGVPEGTDSMKQFCYQFKNRWSREGGMAVIHCSAGVGRTGTLIATDILIKAIKAERKIDVFNTILELRKQRKSMVQTEKQYMYIYQLLKSMLEVPINEEEDTQEHLYENVIVDVNTKDKDIINDESGIAESAL